MGSEKGLKKFLHSKIFSLLIILVALMIIFTVWAACIGNNFVSGDTFISIIDLLVVTSFLAIGSGALLIAGGIDLSAYMIGALGGILMAASMKYWGMPWPVALILTLIICGAFGFFNAILVNEFNFQPFIATMAMSSIVKAILTVVSVDPKSAQPTNISIVNGFTDFLGSYQLFGFIPITIIIMLIAFVVYGLLFSKSKFGMSVYLVGGNPVAARLSGLNPKKISYILFTNSAVLAAVSGIVLMARTKGASLMALSTNMFTGLTAAMIGGISFGGGSGGMGGVFVGLAILSTFSKGVAVVKFDTYWINVLTGLILIIALSFDFNSTKKLKKITPKKDETENVKEQAVSR